MPSIVDIHPHVISPDTGRYPLNPLGGKQSTWWRDRPTPFEVLVTAMDKAGVAKEAIVQASTAYGHDNSYVADAIVAHPKRFTGVFSVDVLSLDAVEKMKYWIGKGFSGMRLFTTGSTMPGQATWFDDPCSFPAWDYAGKASIPVCMQMTPQGFPQLRALLDRFKDVRVILDHLARPNLVDGPPFAADREFLRRTRTSSSSSLRSMSPRTIGERRRRRRSSALSSTVLARIGSRGARTFPRPMNLWRESLGKAQAALAHASSEEHAWIFGGTAQWLYPSLKD